MSQRGGRVASGSIGTAPRLCGTCRCRRQRQKVNGGQSSASEPAIECRALLSERRAIDRESASHANPPPNASPLQVATINQSIAPLFFGGMGTCGLMEHDGVFNLNPEPPGGRCTNYHELPVANDGDSFCKQRTFRKCT